jgi:hypothetical protein
MLDLLNWIDGHGWTTFGLVVALCAIVAVTGEAIGHTRRG